MRLSGDQLQLAPTDLSTFVGCRHRTGLELAVAHGALYRPADEDPYAAILRRKGAKHEAGYVESLRARGLQVVTIARDEGPATVGALAQQADRTLAAMRAGTEVIVQARLAHGTMAGYADVLMRVGTASRLGAWSYEAQDTKLARETRGTAILQLCAYSELLAHLQDQLPAHFHIVTPDVVRPVHTFRTADYMAYYRTVRRSLETAVARGHERLRSEHYPEPVEPCAVCAWEAQCLRRRRQDDHLSFIANAGRVHRQELALQGYSTLAAAAAMAVPVTFTPSRGARETYDRLGDQARVQHQQRLSRQPVFERLPVARGMGLARLPEPSPGDVFLDLEGARFAREGGREFLFGVFTRDRYAAWWAMDDREERHAFEAVMDLILSAWQSDAGMHVYHFNQHEPTAFKKLVGRHVTRAEAMDQLLRAERFVDLYPVARQAVRCGVESYSVKQLEQYYSFTRGVALSNVAQPLLAVELALEAQMPEAISHEIRKTVVGYNEDDCRSTAALRHWLERLRADVMSEGADIPRPATPDGDPSAKVSALQQQVEQLRRRLLDQLPPEAIQPNHPDHARWLLAYLIDWHRREENADWWDFFRLVELPDEALLDERKAIAGLRFIADLDAVVHKTTGRPTGSVIRRFQYPPQEIEIGRSGNVVLESGEHYGTIEGHDRAARTIDLKSKSACHPSTVFSKDVVNQEQPQKSVIRLAERLLQGSVSECGLDLLERRPPRLAHGTFTKQIGEAPADMAVRLVTNLRQTALAIQGPPGAGKTFTGARMVLALVRAGKKVGITATGHKVIVNLLTEVLEQARAEGLDLRVGRKPGDSEDAEDTPIQLFRDNDASIAALRSDSIQVFGGTAWLWSREEATRAVGVLFVDEAGQMSLANVLAVSQAADSLVLLGDPRQLDQPQKASHPDGVGISALEHVLNGAETMPDDRGLFLPATYRMSPAITRFTSELFYEGKLQAVPALAAQALGGTGRFDGSGLWLLPVVHDGNQNASTEEVEAVLALVASLLGGPGTVTSDFAAESATVEESASKTGVTVPGPYCIDRHGVAHPLTGADIKVVAPFNAQVNRLAERLAPHGVAAGTVDKFQGQTAAVVIYSMTTSRPEDAPRGMEFLYSLNRLNVATSRARCAVFVVCSPLLLAPECRTPRQMHLANGLCRYAELAMS